MPVVFHVSQSHNIRHLNKIEACYNFFCDVNILVIESGLIDMKKQN